MYQWSWRSSLIALLIAGNASLAARPAQAGAILDWLFGPQPAANRQVVSYYAPTTSYYAGRVVAGYPAYAPATPTVAYRAAGPTVVYQAPNATVAYRAPSPTVTYRARSSYLAPTAGQTASSACYSPRVVYQAPQNLCSPAPVACAPQPTKSGWGGLGSCLRRDSTRTTAARLPRQAYYRTSWKQVPVTSYRPITSADPITGSPVTVMKACTTYTWQPTRRRCGFFGRLFGQCDPGPAVTTCPTNPCVTQCTVTPSCCGPAMPAATPCGPTTSAPAAVPYYNAPTPATPPGANVLPPVVSPPPTLAPPNLPPTGVIPPAGAAGAREPADTRPSLKPAIPDSNSGIAAPQPPSSSSSPWNSGLPGSNAPLEHPTGPALSGPQPPTPPRATINRMVPLPGADSPAAPPNAVNPSMNVKPVPGPNATPRRSDDKVNAPQLLDPHDQVASLRASQAWAYTTISWSQPKRTTPGRVTASPTTREPVTLRREMLDDSGWHSIAK